MSVRMHGTFFDVGVDEEDDYDKDGEDDADGKT